MKEYIEREAVNALIEAECSPKVAAFLNHAIDNIPAADVVEVRHGRWIDSEEDGHLSICGVCNYPVDRFYKTNYCPCCGARMDGGVNDAADLCGRTC